MLSRIQSMGLLGIEPFPISIEVNLVRAIPSFDIVGLPDAAVRESRERVRAAVLSSGFPFPEGRIVVNLAPANVRKVGSLYDLPILVGILQAQGLLPELEIPSLFLGELSLSGEVRQVNGVLPMLLDAAQTGIKRAFIPYGNAQEAAAVEGLEIYAVRRVQELANFLLNGEELPLVSQLPTHPAPSPVLLDFSDVKDQHLPKRALEVVAAGGHNVLLIGNPGTGKSMLAKRLPSILPEMTPQEAVETTKIYSVCGQLPQGVSLITHRPFRAPHHSTSAAGLCGGGSVPQPGEISLAHNGVLFLDELPEFNRQALESLRQPLEDGRVTHARASARLTYPARFMLVAAMNPCPCGYLGHPVRKCVCTPQKVSAYLNRISGPLLDRMDVMVEVPPVTYDKLSAPSGHEETSAQIRERVNRAWEIQKQRFAGSNIFQNALIPPALLNELCPMDREAQAMLRKVFEKLGMSGRAYDRILKTARTIADLDGSTMIRAPHLSEAVQYRTLDRKYWNQG